MNNNFLYKDIEIENYDSIIAELRTFFLRNSSVADDSMHFILLDKNQLIDESPFLSNWLSVNNLRLKNAALIMVKENAKNLSPHIDTQENALALNFPILNCKNCWTSIYKLVDGKEILGVLPNGQTYINFDNSAKFEELTRFNLDNPVIFNTKFPHQVWNPNNTTRISASLRFVEDPWHLVNKKTRITLPGVVTPLSIDKNPLINQAAIFEKFDQTKKGNQVLHYTDEILKPEVKKIINDRGLKIEKIDVWKWSVDLEKNAPAHTDGASYPNGRKVGLNWGLTDNQSCVEFYDASLGKPETEYEPDGREHTLWHFPNGTTPSIVWDSTFPSLINPQVPHHIIGQPGSFRYSMTIKFINNPSYNFVLEKLWDLREDIDSWEVKIVKEDFDELSCIINELEKSIVPIEDTVSSYVLPRDPALIRLIEKFIKKPIKTIRLINYREGGDAKIHIDYDNVLKASPSYALNIPLYGSEHCYIDFYKNLGGVKELWHEGTGSYLLPCDDSKVFLNSTLLINKPHLLRINVPHAVRITNKSKRKVLSIRFIDDYNDLPSDIVKFK